MALTRQAWMNIEMDELAKQTIDHDADQPTRYCIPEEPWCCYIAGTRVVKNIEEKLRSHINNVIIEEHWDKKMRYKQGHKSMIDYEMARQAIRNSPPVLQRWVTKSAAQFLPYGTNMK